MAPPGHPFSPPRPSPLPPTPPPPLRKVIAGRARGSRVDRGGWVAGARGGPRLRRGTPAETGCRVHAAGGPRLEHSAHQAARCPPPPAGCPARAPEVAAGGRTRGFRRRAPQDVSSPSPYLVKVFLDSVIQRRGAAAAAPGAGPATAPLPPRAAGPQALRPRDGARGRRARPSPQPRPRPGPCEGRGPPRAAWEAAAEGAAAGLCHFSRPPHC